MGEGAGVGEILVWGSVADDMPRVAVEVTGACQTHWPADSLHEPPHNRLSLASQPLISSTSLTSFPIPAPFLNSRRVGDDVECGWIACKSLILAAGAFERQERLQGNQSQFREHDVCRVALADRIYFQRQGGCPDSSSIKGSRQQRIQPPRATC